jgi:undecaprenyl diphosphate synthase
MQHLAMIMGGNRRWARENKLKAAFLGYDTGAKSIRRAVSFCLKKNIKHLSLYTFSLENFRRPEEEKKYLFTLLGTLFKNEIENLIKDKIRVRFLGDRSYFPEAVSSVINETEERTKDFDRLSLNFLFCYGGRQEIAHSARQIAQKVQSGEMAIDEINEETVGNELWTAGIPDPDLIVRTGSKNEIRLSNFLLYQAAYSELLFLDCYWPEINEEKLQYCFDSFNKSVRKFGV